MPLTGEAKRNYQREFMRRKRAAQPKREKPPWRPTQRLRETVTDCVKYTNRRPAWAATMFDDLYPFDGDDEAKWTEACRRYKAGFEAERKREDERKREAVARRKAERAEQRAKHELWMRSCEWCHKPRSADRKVISNGSNRICVACARAVIRWAESGSNEPVTWDEWLAKP